MDKIIREAIEKTDAHERLRCAIQGRRYEPLADRKKVATLIEALGQGTSITTALARLKAGRPSAPAPMKDLHEQLRRAL